MNRAFVAVLSLLAPALLAAAQSTAPATAPAEPTTAPTTAPATPEQIDRWIRQLDARSFEQRQQAVEALRLAGAAASEPLHDALDAGVLGYEGARRARALLTVIGVPRVGVVYRPHLPSENYDPNNPDVLVALDETPVRNLRELRILIGAGGGEGIFHRTGLGTGRMRVTAGELSNVEFLDWPDRRELYRRHGHHGPWDSAVDIVFYRLQFHDHTYIEALDNAWDAGCRDPMLLWETIRHHRALTRFDVAEEMLDQRVGQVESRYDGGEFYFGQLPAERVRLLLAQGLDDQARAALDEALAALGDVEDSDAAERVLRRLEATMALAESTAAAIDVIDRHGELIGPNFEMATIAQLLAAEGGSSEAVAFLQDRPEGIERDFLLRKHQAQAALDEAAPEPAEPTHYVPVWSQRKIGLWRHDRGMERWPIREIPLPARLEMRWRIPIAPRHDLGEEAGAGVMVRCPGAEDEGETRFAMLHTLSGRLMDWSYPAAGEASTFSPWRVRFADSTWIGRTHMIAPAMEYRRCTIDVSTHRLLVEVDGRPWRRLVFQSPRTGPAAFYTAVARASGEWRDVVLSTAGPADVDPEAMLDRLNRLREAWLALDLPAVETLTAEVLAVLDRIDGTEPLARRYRTRLEHVRAMCSDKGLPISTQAMLDSADVGAAHYIVEKGDLMLAPESRTNTRQRLRLPIAATDFELTGALYPGPGSGRNQIQWNAVNDEHAYPWMWNLFVFRRHNDDLHLMLGGWSENPRVEARIADDDRPHRFRLRVRGPEAVLVTEGFDQPLRIDNAHPTGQYLVIFGRSRDIGEPTSPHLYRDLVIRALAPEAELDEPLAAP